MRDDCDDYDEVVTGTRFVLAECSDIASTAADEAVGGEVAPADAGWAVGVHCSDVDQQTWMTEADKSVRLLSSHKDQVLRLPEGAQIYASNAFCPIAGFTMGNQVWTIQGHPEFLPEYAHSLMTFRRKILGETVYAQGLASLSEVTDAELVAEWMMNFVAQDGGATSGDAL